MNKSSIILSLLLITISCGGGGGGTNNKMPNSVSPLMKEVSDDSKVNYKPYFESEDLMKTFSSKGPIPKKTDSRYTLLVSKRNKAFKQLNYTTFEEGLRDIKISALHLVLGGSNSDQVYDQIRSTTDVRSLEIEAETVEIHDLLRLAGTNVTIRAKEIIFSGGGMIDTSPINKTEKPYLQQNGADGLKAGDITLIADKFIGNDELTLIANGGRGQDAGPGQDGSRGHNANIVYGSHLYEIERESCRQTCHGGGICNTLCSYRTKKGRPAGNGQNAIPGGRPGNGGDAGTITVNKLMNLRFSVEGGAQGASDKLRVGGEPGTPQKSCKRNYKGRDYDCVIVVKGRDAAAPIASKGNGASTSLNVVDQQMISPGMVKMQLKYAKDLYKNNQVELAQKSFMGIQAHLESVDKEDFVSMGVRTEAQALENQIILHRDYFGKTKTWTPNLAFEVSFKAFDKEIKRNLRLLYFTHWLQTSMKDLSEKREAIKNLQDELFVDVESKRIAIVQLVNESSEMTKAMEDLKIAQNEFDFELKLVEKEILEKARNNLEVPFHKKALALISAASKSIPVGQPTFGMVGTGLDFIDQLSAKDADYVGIAKQVPDLLESFKGFNWKGATEELNTALKGIDPSDFSELKSNEQKIQYFKKIGDFSSPIYSAINKQMKAFRSQEVSRSKLEDEINKIKRKHGAYNKLIQSLDKLHAKKEQYRILISNFYHSIEAALVGIDNNYISIASSYDELHNMNGVVTSEFKHELEEIRESALDRLHFYHYLFSKSYEYRYLKYYHKSFNFEILFEKMTGYININSHAIEANVEKIQSFYEGELASIISDIVSQNENLNIELSKEYNFSMNEVEALNNGEKIYIDLTNFFDEDKEDIRLRSVKLMDHFYFEGAASDIELTIQHSGKSVFKRNGVSYLFEHSDVNSSNLTWISYRGQNATQLTYSSTSSQDESIFRLLFDLGDRTEIFIRPGGETFLSVQLKKNKNTRVKDLSLDIEYDSKLKNI